MAHLNLTLKTVSRPKNVTGFVVLPRRWVVERSLAWIMHGRRHARDYERLIQHSESLMTWAAITLMTRRITRLTSRTGGDSRPPAKATGTDHLQHGEHRVALGSPENRPTPIPSPPTVTRAELHVGH